MFWERYSTICNNNGKSPNGVAKAIGLSTAICTKWKNGAVPNSEALIKLANYFDVTTDYLLGRSDNPTMTPPAEDIDTQAADGAALLAIYNRLSPVDRAKLLLYADGLTHNGGNDGDI